MASKRRRKSGRSGSLSGLAVLVILFGLFTFRHYILIFILIAAAIFIVRKLCILSKTAKFHDSESGASENFEIDTPLQHNSGEDTIHRNFASLPVEKEAESVLSSSVISSVFSYNAHALTLTPIACRTDRSVLSLSDYVVLDVETTGFDPKSDRIVEVGILKIVNNEIVDQFGSLVNPERHIPSSASAVNGIYDEDVFDAPKYEEIAYRVVELLKDQIVIGHNVTFDLKFINALYYYTGLTGSVKYIDTLSYSRFVFPDRKDHKLQSLAADFSLNPTGQHRALADAETTKDLFELCRSTILEREAAKKAERKQRAAEEKALRAEKYSASPLYNTNFVFTGVFKNDRRDMYLTLTHLGANVREEVNRNTDYLVAGNLENLPDWAKERKYNVAMSLAEQGKKVKIVSEEDCLSLIEETKKVFIPVP